VNSEFPHCTVCQAPVSLRATTCAVCEAPAPPIKRPVQAGEIQSGEWVRFQRPPEELRELYGDVVKALLPNIRILGMVGEGGMAIVFVGRDAILKREVAVKVLSPTLADDVVARKRFTREAEAIAAVQHPNIVNVYQVGEIASRGLPYFVMQFVDGPTLGMGALRGMMLTEARVRRLVADVAAGLAAAHRRKVYHRDIKPGNIVLDGESGRAMVLDFGISAASSSRRKSAGLRLTEEGMYLGTPTYMSPEQGNGEDVTGKSDVYSLGVLAFELLVGRPPFEGTPIAVMAAHLRDTPQRVDELRSDVSEEMASLVARCLEKDAKRRPEAQEIVHVLVPGEKQTVEWPPPGMSRVRGIGARFLAAMSATSVCVATFFAILAIWPEIAELRALGGHPSVVRSFLLGACLAIIFGVFTMTLFYGLLGAQQWHWARNMGYPAWVIADVCCDSRRDAGTLVNGTGDFVLVEGPTRRALLAFRRARYLMQVVAAVVALAGVTRWIAAWMGTGGSRSEQDVAIRWAMPILGAYVVYVLLGIPEWRIRRRERANIGRRPSGENAPPLKGELVKMWMASAERARKSLSGNATGDGT
jgi:tRNA A-37 threonylcarbamoyl transferase component Bud32